MFCGLAFFGCWTWVLSTYENMTVGNMKNVFIVGGLLLILAIAEVLWEVKKGFKLIFAIPKKIILKIHKKLKIWRIENKYKKNKKLKEQEIIWYRQNKVVN